MSIRKCIKDNCRNPALFPYLYCEKCLDEYESQTLSDTQQKDKWVIIILALRDGELVPDNLVKDFESRVIRIDIKFDKLSAS